ncbi:DNA mismatch repair endonuclease MutL [Buchnera aphidicola (Hyperomyzus lactucae)]|uniref:DNA mismatch repair protein MutL n=1 Tax=Buchnera aphidicola (Hyperomyzus lactucae) TaxID=1241860 RepID=A0A4D6YAD7_9GAMM|nr:DNA mismatch repair endonuclease MutL [Buchnera aphidicola]QCI21275.1 DNA mismatch repair endonuclease MutL [Buchnera aphidicola (Hyperomyzus lactucae)]
MPILILPSDLSSQISSGEIIDRPASVVKEIIENSIDAGAKNINIIIEKSGFQSILIRDDGCGIKKKELLLAITHHATSKINSLSDLDAISTFGFRGEALASIRAVSRLTLISCTHLNSLAWKIYSERFIDNHITVQPIAHPKGTTVIVENLFYNIPVRLKFIKNKRSEFFKIFEVIKKIALSHFDINFSLKHNEKLIAQYNSVNNEQKKIYRLRNILNTFNINKSREIQSKKDDIFLFGWISYLQDCNNLKKIQYCYVNNRCIYNKLFVNAICNAYYKIVGNKNISFILYLKIPPNNIDVNIHPTKNEIKFHQPNIIYIFIYEAILCNLKKITYKYSSKNILFKNIYEKKELNKSGFFNSNLKSCLKKDNTSIGKLLIVIRKYYGLICYRNDFFLISLPLAQGIVEKKKLINDIEKKIIPEYFLTNIKLNSTLQEYIILFNNRKILSKIGFHLIFKKKYVILSTTPCFLKNNIDLILSFFKFLFLRKKISILEMINWFYINVFIELKDWNYINGIAVILEIEYYYPLLLKNPPPKLLQKIDIDAALCILKL